MKIVNLVVAIILSISFIGCSKCKICDVKK